jgi:group I intron endonuclease
VENKKKMKIDHKKDQVSGIYCIRNTVNQKVYIGKSVNIAKRMSSHKQCLRKKSKDENRHLISAWWKYGENAFEYFILEVVSKDIENYEKVMSEKELKWMEIYNSTNREKGYNLRLDSSTKMITHEETRKLFTERKGKKNSNYGNKWTDEMKKSMSELKKEGYKTGKYKASKENSLKGVAVRNALWEKNPELKKQMIKKVSANHTKYEIYQYDKLGNLIKVWQCVKSIIDDNPNYKKHNIYAVCSGEKPTMYGYKWVKVLKVNEDIVQP